MAEKVVERFVTEYLFREDKRALSRIERRIDSIRRRLDTTSRRATMMGVAMAAPLLGVARKAYVTDEAMRRLEARTGATADQMARLKQQAYDLGSRLPLDTADIIKAQTAYFQLGNTIEETFRAAPTIAKLAVAAEGVSVEDVARYLSIAKNNYKLTTDQVTLLGDQMLKMETITAGTFRAIGEAFQFSGQSAADAKLSQEEYVALLGTVAGAGREVESVSQGVNVILTKIARAMSGFGRGGKMVKKAFEGIDIEVEEIRGLMEQGEGGFLRVLKLIQQRSPNQAALTSSLATLGGESYAAAISYLIQNLNKYESAITAAHEAAGETDRQATIMMGGLSGAVKLGMAQVDTLVNKLADLELAAPMEKAIRTFARFVDWLIETNAQGEHVRGGLLSLIANFMKLGVVLIAVGVALKAASWILGGYVVGLKAARGAIAAYQAVVIAATVAQRALTGATAAGTAADVAGRLARRKGIGAVGQWIARVGTAVLSSKAWVLGLVKAKAALLLVGKAVAAVGAVIAGLSVGWIVAGVLALGAALYAVVTYWTTLPPQSPAPGRR